MGAAAGRGPDEPVLDLRMAPGASAPRDARNAIAERYGEHVRCGDLLVCVSEAVTNAVIHARTPFRLVVREVGRLLRVEVSDADPTPPVIRHPEPTSPSGRGMLLIDQLSSTWGVDRRGDGKTVWFEFA